MNASVSTAIASEADALNVLPRNDSLLFFAKVGTDANGNDIAGQADLMDFIGKDCRNKTGILEIVRNTEWQDPHNQKCHNIETEAEFNQSYSTFQWWLTSPEVREEVQMGACCGYVA
jgi:hypothetical protein